LIHLLFDVILEYMNDSKILAAHVSNFLIWQFRDSGDCDLTNLKLQKLLYYAQAWFLALHKSPIFDEDFQAWVHGPVVRTEYDRFKSFRWNSIVDASIGEKPCFSQDIEKHLNEIISEFGTESAVALELMTHREKPWLEARGSLAPDASSSNIITKKAMQDFYTSL
jgi:uncharacterized phage-associated protein